MIDDPAIRRAMNERTERLASFYQMQRRAGFCVIEANEAMNDYAKRLDQIERDKVAADDQFSRELAIIRSVMERTR